MREYFQETFQAKWKTSQKDFFHKGSKHRNHDAEIMRLGIPNSALFILLSIFVKGMLTDQVSLTLNDSADLVCYLVSVVFASAPYV